MRRRWTRWGVDEEEVDGVGRRREAPLFAGVS